MAGRTGMGVGLGITLFVLSATTLAFGVGTAIYFTKAKDAEQALKTVQADTSNIITPQEKNNDIVSGMLREATKQKKSLVGFLRDEMAGTMQRVTGNQRDTVAALDTRLNGIDALKGGGKPVMSHVSDLQGRVAALEAQVQAAEAARNKALADFTAESERIRGIEDNYKRTVATIGSTVDANSQAVTENRQQVDEYKKQLDERLARELADAAAREKNLQAQLDKAVEERVVAVAQLERLRGGQKKDTLTAGSDASNVDATIVSVDGGARRAYLNVGSEQKAGLGMTFVVYGDASAIRPDAEGNYPPGKATLEIINVGRNTSTAMITSEIRGNPIVQGDVAANAVYDPNKTYKFVVAGNFDANRDGIATALEKREIEAMIREWKGSTSNEIGADVDFLLMGERPVMPAQPAENAPSEVFRDFVRREDEVKAYDAMYQAAIRASIPVLNENRFYTLIGRTPVGVQGRASR